MELLEGKVVIVSGVGPGLGRECAVAAARDGASVMLGARRQENLEKAAAEIDPDGKTVGWKTTDICDESQCQALVAEAMSRFGRVDGLVNVAALDSVMGGLDTSAEEWRQTLETNVIGTLQMVRAAAAAMKQSGGGSVVMIGSQTTFWPAPLAPQLIYGASKGALASAVWFLNRELGPSKIRVNTVVPTWMWGPPVEMFVGWMVESEGITQEQALARITGPMPLGEIPSDGDVANAVAFFLSDRARMISGQTLFVNAGEFPH
ncbi:MAG TPA: SDR family oxidoreductase [Acidimicrobiales bacterium]|nr:SDR family oxidoreductase [Acidimicrobiales bacterium]